MKGNISEKKHYVPLRWELVRTLVPLLVIAVIVMQTMVYFTARQAMIDSTDRLLEADAATMAAKVNSWAENVKTQINMLVSMIEVGQFSEEPDLSNYLKSHALDMDYCDQGMYVVVKDGTLIKATERGNYPEYLTQDWFVFGMTNAEADFTQSSSQEQNLALGNGVTIASSYQEGGKSAGIVCADISVENITKMLETFAENMEEEILLLDSNSDKLIGATQKEYQNTNTQDAFILALLSDMEKDSFRKRYGARTDSMFTAVSKVDGTPWYIVTYLPRETALDTLDTIVTSSVMGAFLLVILIILRVIQVANRSLKPLIATKDILLKLTSGDFTIQVPQNKKRRRNEITDINESLSGFLETMRSLLTDIDKTSDKLSAHAKDYSSMAADLNRDSITQMESVGNLNSSMEQIAESIQQLALHATELDSLAVDTRENSQQAQKRMDHTLESTKITNEHMDTIAASVYATGQSMDELSSLMEQMQESTVQIHSITEVIMDIASQTNLLSLNASIEAARAGNQGRGFAVVAQEIKRLAESSEENAEKIGNHIETITKLIETTANSTSRSLEDVHTSVELMGEMEQEMSQVSQAIEETGSLLKDVTNHVVTIAEISTSIAAISEEQAAGSQEVVATSSRINELVQNTKEKSDRLKEGTQVLANASEDLGSHMEIFTL